VFGDCVPWYAVGAPNLGQRVAAFHNVRAGSGNIGARARWNYQLLPDKYFVRFQVVGCENFCNLHTVLLSDFGQIFAALHHVRF
jgi:hypothetical protein